MAENEKQTTENEIIESNAARRMRLRGEDMGQDVKTDDIKVNKLQNFWYHNKVWVIIAAFFAVMITIVSVQYAKQSNPDIYLIYGGPEDITANEAKAFSSLLEDMMDDYNGDGKKLVQINEFVFMTPEQVDKIQSEPDNDGNDVVINLNSNLETYNRYSNEIFGTESIICILGEAQYEELIEAGGLIPLSELFETVPQGAIDEYGVRLSETKLYAYSPAARIFPNDAIIAIRKLSTMSSITGKKKAEALHGYAKDMFVKILSFEFPDDVPTDPIAEQ
ncbi:MAG: hypothetical protein E7628_02340 [Ruminococcaceae bacterium]|nr:hypothetical protein [Oscillospiraceae bacterium]